MDTVKNKRNNDLTTCGKYDYSTIKINIKAETNDYYYKNTKYAYKYLTTNNG